ncbi:MAG: NAD(P)/FAD-dependent oxidoreductase [Candidatus Saccharimonadales bacterium]
MPECERKRRQDAARIKMMKKHIVVIGGGMAGTAAAYMLVGRGYDVTIIEKDDRLGGRMRSEVSGNIAIEMGAGFITNAYTNVRAFLASTGLGVQLYGQRGSSGILRGGKVAVVNPGTILGGGVLSWRAKLRAVAVLMTVLIGWRQLDFQEPWRAAKYDTQSVAELLRGRAGNELLERVVQPILNSYFYWSPERTSAAVLLVIGKAMLRGGTYKLRGGLQQIPQRAAEGSRTLIGHAVTRVQRNPTGVYDVTVEHEGKLRKLQADGVVCATTASVVSKIIPDLSDRQQAFFSSVEYSSTVVVAQTFKKEQARGTQGLAFPRKEGSAVAVVTVSPEPDTLGRGPKLSVVKIYASGAEGALLCRQPDKAIITTLTAAMAPVRKAVLYEGAKPISTYVQRWHEALPIFEAGRAKQLEAFMNGEVEDPNHALVFAGDYIGGPFIEGAFTSGVMAADRLEQRISGANKRSSV